MLKGIIKIHYLLDSERAGKTRKSINNGYYLIKRANEDLLVRINVIEHLNILAGTHGLFSFQINNLLENDFNYDEYTLKTVYGDGQDAKFILKKN